MPVLGLLLSLGFALLALRSGRQWRRYAQRGARPQARHAGVCCALDLVGTVVLLLMATGRFA